jgi:CHAT domain-containing protein/Tfp pilus assembly protein PilF
MLQSEVAITYKNLGEFQQALSHYERALEGQERSGDKYGVMSTLLNAGNVYSLLGDSERAIDHYERSLVMARAVNERRGQGLLLGNLGSAWLESGEPARAIPYLRQSLELTRAIGNRNGEGVALVNLGHGAAAVDDLVEARAYYAQALAIQREIGARAFAGSVLVAMAGVSIRANDLAAAAGEAAEALTIARETGNAEMEWAAQHLLARVARGEGRTEEALGLLRASMETINGLRGRIRTDAGKVGYLEMRQAVFHDVVDLLVTEGRHQEALEAAEAARSRAFVDLLAERRIAAAPADASALAGIREEETRLRTQSRLRPEGDAGRAELMRTRSNTMTAIGERLDAIRSARPELASLVVADPPSFAQMSQIGRRLGATVVEYFVTEKRLFVFVIDARGQVTSRTVDVTRSQLRQSIGDVHRMLNELDAEGLRDQRALQTGLAGLHRLLVAPIPHDALLRVPFAALLDDRGRPVLRRHTLAFAPSLDVLRYTADKKAEGAPRLLALADPATGADALPGARGEVRQLSRHFPATRRTVLLGADASEANGKRLAPGQSILHFAVHGLIDDGRPLDSALLLAEGGGEDGTLRVSEAFGLRLNADLVVLSGCSTGLGKVTGDGILGLARAFLYAGTPSVVVSQWDVSDKATAFLMDRFYAGLQAGRGKARSLRQAQIATSARFPHPALWAAFSLVGEP